MTYTKINRVIAEALGAKKCPIHHSFECCGNTVKPYYTDLNAMFTAEETLDLQQIARFSSELHRLSLESYAKGESSSGLWSIWHSTPSQRAEAFLKALGKWNEV